ncbi:hypothetical protein G6F31_019934 [Rhizopus arrhizus]|nr:hypothetical protein G6F31_019934 [Rhizopus arrhizus]
MPEDQRSRGGLLMRARLFTWLNVARDEAARAGRPAPATVAAFWPMADEPALRPLRSQGVENGVAVALPVPGTRGGRRSPARRGSGADARLHGSG